MWRPRPFDRRLADGIAAQDVARSVHPGGVCMLTVGTEAPGTPESSWRASGRLTDSPAMSWGVAGRVVVLAPHPDDEVLAVGGAMVSLRRAGWSIHLLAVTDGEASHPRSRRISPGEMAVIRAGERTTAMARLGLGDVEVTRLRYADSAVDGAGELAEHIGAFLEGASLCLAPWKHDGRPDYDATGRAAAAACATLGTKLVEYPVWAWHWARPSTRAWPWMRTRRVPLAPDVLMAKRRAIAAYRSQLAPLGPARGDAAVLPHEVVARFHRPFETVFAD